MLQKPNATSLIIGAGVVGLATGMALLQHRPYSKVNIAEKENTSDYLPVKEIQESFIPHSIIHLNL